MWDTAIQSVLSVAEIDPFTRKALRVNIQFCPMNKRTIEVLSPMIKQRMPPGGGGRRGGGRN